MFVWQGLITGKRDYTYHWSLYSILSILRLMIAVFIQTFLRHFCQNPNLTSPQRLSSTWKWLCIPPHPTQTTTHTNSISAKSQLLLPDFDETLKVGSCEHLEQVPTVTMTFVQATFVLATYVLIRNISAVTDPILMKLCRYVPGNI